MPLNASGIYSALYPDPTVVIRPLKRIDLLVVDLKLIPTVEIGLIDRLHTR
jgi:hypothetical protein